MSLLFTLELFMILFILVILPDDIGEGDKTCWIIDHNQENLNILYHDTKMRIYIYIYVM